MEHLPLPTKKNKHKIAFRCIFLGIFSLNVSICTYAMDLNKMLLINISRKLFKFRRISDFRVNIFCINFNNKRCNDSKKNCRKHNTELIKKKFSFKFVIAKTL